jgi:hypothetical protein
MDAFPEAERALRRAAHRRLRSPNSVRGPKRRAWALEDGEPVDAARALAGAGLYEYGCRPVHRKRLAGAPATEDRSWYFAFDPQRLAARDGVCDVAMRHSGDGAGGEGATFTQAMLQAILCEKRFVQCTVDGVLFSSDLTDVVRERPHSADGAMLLDRRRPDVSARAVRASDPRLNGKPLDVVIAPAGAAFAYDQIGDLIGSGRTCLEISVPRDVTLERDPEALEASLRAGLLAGAFSARWVVAPDGARAAVRPVHDVRRLLAKHRAQARDEQARAQTELAAAQELLRAPEPLSEEEQFHDRAALARVDAEWEALFDFAERCDRDREAPSMIQLVAEIVAPALRDPRLRTRTLRLARIRLQLRARNVPPRSGLMKRVDTLERALYAHMSHVAVRRADAASRAAVAAASMRRAERRLAALDLYQIRLDELERAGAGELLFPPGTSIRRTIAFEHRRRFGTGAPASSALSA